MRGLLMPLAKELYALPLERIREVATHPVVTPLPLAPKTVLGLFSLRGEIIPLFDSAVLIRRPPLRTATHAVVVQTENGPAGLATSGIPEIVSFEDDDLVAPPEIPQATGTYSIGGRLVVMLSADVMLALDQIAGMAL